MTLTRAEALRIARELTTIHLWRYRQLVGAGCIPAGEDGHSPGEQLNEVERTCADVVARLDEMIREEEERVKP